MARGGHFEYLTLDECFTVAMHCCPYVFILYMMSHLNVGDDNDDVYAYVT